MEQIEQDLKAIIAKNLPQAVGETLQARLKQADADAEELRRLKGSNESYIRDAQNERARRERAEADLAKHAALKEREDAVSKRERDAEITELKIYLKSANDNANFAQHLLNQLVRNTEFRETVHHRGNENVPFAGGGTYPGGVNSMQFSKSTDTTRTTD